MNIDETASILYALSVANHKVTVGVTEISFWAPKWESLDYQDAEKAVNGYYGEGGAYQATREHIGPADVVPLAVLERNRRTKRPEVIAPGCYEPDPVARAALTTAGPRALPGPFERDITRDVRVHSGLAQCSDVLEAIAQRLAAGRSDEDPDESDARRQRALAVARAARRGSRA